MIFRLSRWSPMLVALPLLLGSGVHAQQAPPYRVGGEVTRPEKISGEPPVYTEMARKARITGVVIVEVIIDEQGNVTETRVLKGLPMGLDQAAVEAVETWKFKPATWQGKPVPVYYNLTVNFQLDSGLDGGPLFMKYMQENPELGELVRNGDYSKALAFLDDRGASPENRLARTYVLLALGRVEEAWKEARAYDGPEPYEVFHEVAGSARDLVIRGEDGEVRARRLEIGLQAAARALEERTGDVDATYIRVQLLLEKAKLESDPEERRKLLEEAEELKKRAAGGQTKPG